MGGEHVYGFVSVWVGVVSMFVWVWVVSMFVGLGGELHSLWVCQCGW